MGLMNAETLPVPPVPRGVERGQAMPPSTPSGPRMTVLPETDTRAKTTNASLVFQTPVKQIRLSPASASGSVVKSPYKSPKAFDLSMNGVVDSKGGDGGDCSMKMKEVSTTNALTEEEEPSLYAQLGWDEY